MPYDDDFDYDDYVMDDDGFVQTVTYRRYPRPYYDGFRRYPHHRDFRRRHGFPGHRRFRRFPRHYYGRPGFGIGLSPFGLSPFLFF